MAWARGTVGEVVAQDRGRPEERSEEQEDSELEHPHAAPAHGAERDVSRRSRSCMTPITNGGA